MASGTPHHRSRQTQLGGREISPALGWSLSFCLLAFGGIWYFAWSKGLWFEFVEFPPRDRYPRGYPFEVLAASVDHLWLFTVSSVLALLALLYTAVAGAYALLLTLFPQENNRFSEAWVFAPPLGLYLLSGVLLALASALNAGA